MEHPLRSHPHPWNDLQALARALLYAEQTLEAHAEVLGASFVPPPAAARLRQLARRALGYTSPIPQPRLQALVRALETDGLFQKTFQAHVLRVPLLPSPARMRPLPGIAGLPALANVGELARWLRLDADYLAWMADLRDRNASPKPSALSHYHRRLIAKRDGSFRLLEPPKQHLKHIQRQILREILSAIPLHDAVHGFRRGRSIVTFARPHAGKHAVLRLDLQDFFPSVSGPRAQALFRTLGYPEPVADLLGGLCTTTTPPGFWRASGCDLAPEDLKRARIFYARPHLPQGAPSSPALANACAFRLDRRLAALAEAANATYTRYADDLAFSGDRGFARSAGRFAIRAAAIVAEEGFSVHPRKTRLMRSSVRQHLAGLTVNVQPNLPRRDLEQLEAMLTNCVRRGPDTQNRAGHPDFRRHLQGRVEFAAMVNGQRAHKLEHLLASIRWD